MLRGVGIMKPFQVVIFGKEGCDKCQVLKKRMGKILERAPYDQFELVYHSLGKMDGLVKFCRCEVLNPQRIPSFMVFRREGDRLSTVRCSRPLPDSDETLDTVLAVETDYRSTGVITPAMIRQALDTALAEVMANTQV